MSSSEQNSNQNGEKNDEGKRPSSAMDETDSFTSQQPALKERMMMLQPGPQESLAEYVQRQMQSFHAEVFFLKNWNVQLVNSINSLIADNRYLCDELNKVREEVDSANQYSRGWNLRIFGIVEGETKVLRDKEDPRDLVVQKCADYLQLSIEKWQIGACHRLGVLSPAYNPEEDKPRPILCQFISRQLVREIIDKAKAFRQVTAADQIYFSEDLTRLRAKLLSSARAWVRDGELLGAWSIKGLIKVRCKNDSVEVIRNERDLLAAIAAVPTPPGTEQDQEEAPEGVPTNSTTTTQPNTQTTQAAAQTTTSNSPYRQNFPPVLLTQGDPLAGQWPRLPSSSGGPGPRLPGPHFQDLSLLQVSGSHVRPPLPGSGPPQRSSTPKPKIKRVNNKYRSQAPLPRGAFGYHRPQTMPTPSERPFLTLPVSPTMIPVRNSFPQVQGLGLITE